MLPAGLSSWITSSGVSSHWFTCASSCLFFIRSYTGWKYRSADHTVQLDMVCLERFNPFAWKSRAIRSSGLLLTYFALMTAASREGVAMLPRNRVAGWSPRRNSSWCSPSVPTYTLTTCFSAIHRAGSKRSCQKISSGMDFQLPAPKVSSRVSLATSWGTSSCGKSFKSSSRRPFFFGLRGFLRLSSMTSSMSGSSAVSSQNASGSLKKDNWPAISLNFSVLRPNFCWLARRICSIRFS